MEKTEIDQRIKSLIFYSDSVERSDAPLELKREKLENIEREKLHLEAIIDDIKFKEFLKEFIIGTVIFIAAVSILLFMFVFYGS
jgi:hypothetical protein